MEQENITTYECLKEEVAGMRGDLSRVLDYIVAKEEKERKAREKIDARPQLPLRPMVTKEEAAAILLVSPRHLQRIGSVSDSNGRKSDARPTIISKR